MTPAATLSIAKTFYIAHEKCRGSGLPADNGVPNAIVPSIVCLAFAIEVGLKAVLFASSPTASGHNLKMLFEALPQEDQDRIIFESGVATASFRKNLNLVANAFVEWRYIYEHRGRKTISEQFLLMVWFAVERVAEEKVNVQRRLAAGGA